VIAFARRMAREAAIAGAKAFAAAVFAGIGAIALDYATARLAPEPEPAGQVAAPEPVEASADVGTPRRKPTLARPLTRKGAIFGIEWRVGG